MPGRHLLGLCSQASPAQWGTLREPRDCGPCVCRASLCFCRAEHICVLGGGVPRVEFKSNSSPQGTLLGESRGRSPPGGYGGSALR